MMNFGRGFGQGFKRGASGFKGGAFGGSFKNFARMQSHMTFTQMNMLQGNMMRIQAQQNSLVASNTLLMNMQMNWLLLNEETENGISAAAEDIDAEEDDGPICVATPLTMSYQLNEHEGQDAQEGDKAEYYYGSQHANSIPASNGYSENYVIPNQYDDFTGDDNSQKQYGQTAM